MHGNLRGKVDMWRETREGMGETKERDLYDLCHAPKVKNKIHRVVS